MLDPLYHLVAHIVVGIHAGLAPIFGKDSGASWALAIVLLTMAMRLVLFPLFVKQIKTQRSMQVLQPKMKELQAKYKNDRETLNREMMALYKEHGANPLSGCLPLLLQIPIFISLFHVLNAIQPHRVAGKFVDCAGAAASCSFRASSGLTADLVRSAAKAKIFGAPIAAAFNSKAALLQFLGADVTTVKVLAAAMVVLMGLTTFFTQRQLMARSAPADGPMASQQKILLYVLPFTFGIFGFRFPLGVLLYWLTTNVWSMVQQHVVISRMGPAPGSPAATSAKGAPAVPAKPGAGSKPPANGKRPSSSSPGSSADAATKGAAGGAAPRRGLRRPRKTEQPPPAAPDNVNPVGRGAPPPGAKPTANGGPKRPAAKRNRNRRPR